MATLDRTRALIADLAKVIGLPDIPQDETGGWHLTVGDDGDVYLFGGDDEQILMVVPIAPLPTRPQFALVNYLLRSNMFDSDMAPFQIATDESATLVQWGRLRIADIDGTTLAKIIDNVSARATSLRGEIGSEGGDAV
jgi:hypothetical protein